MRILVIEDEPRILAFLARGARGGGLLRGRGADMGPHGLRACARRARTTGRSSTCCCPGSTGSRSCVSCTQRRPELPVVIVSARSDLPTKLRGFELGASDYLREAVRARRADRADSRPAPRARGHGTTTRPSAPARSTLDLARRQARIGELVADLSDREFRAPAPPRRARRARSSAASGSSRRCGATISIPARTSSTSACAACARSSARRRRSRPCAMRATGSLRRRRRRARLGRVRAREPRRDAALWPRWETIPFHFIWVSLTLLYGFRVWGLGPTASCSRSVVSTGLLILNDAIGGTQEWGELFEVPLMSAMFLAMVWHARRRQDALAKVERQASERAARCSSARSGFSTTSRTSCARR